MSRFQRVVQSVASGYALLATNVLFSLASVPLSLHYLSKDEFGLWAVITQVAGVLVLLEIGISSGAGRLLFDYKDDVTGKRYAEVVSTGTVVMIGQGAVVLGLGYWLVPFLANVLSIPAALQVDFVRWMRWQCVITAAGFTTKILWHLLASRHRYDIANYAQAIVFVVNLSLLWMLYAWGWKLSALVVAGGVGWLLNSAILLVACFRLRIIPRLGDWCRPSLQRLREMFSFAKDVFLVTVGVQLALASQTLVVSRHLGLDAAATWSVCTKALTLISIMVWRISDFSASAFTEMIVRKERERLLDRFRTVVMLTASLSAFSAVSFALINKPFIAEWTAGKMHWSGLNDWLLGLWLVVVSIVRCHTGLVLLTKEIHFLRFSYLIEGICFLLVSEFVAKRTGFPGILFVSIASSAALSGLYGVWRTKNYFGLTAREIVFGWLAPTGRLVMLLLPWAGLVWLGLHRAPNLWQLAGYSVLIGLIGFYAVLRLGVSRSVQREIAQHAPRSVSPILKRILSV